MNESAKAEAASLAVILGGQRAELEAVQAEYEHWSAETARRRENANQAKAELQRRQAQKTYEPEAISRPEPELPEIEPESEPEVSPEADVDERRDCNSTSRRVA